MTKRRWGWISVSQNKLLGDTARSGALHGERQTGMATGKWTPYLSPLSKSAYSGSATTITIQLGSLGGAFTGTIWLDDFKLE